MEYKLKELTLRPVTHDDLDEVARMWNFEKGSISLDEAKKAIVWMQTNHKQNQLHRIVHMCFAVFENSANKIIGWCGLDGRSERAVNMFYLIDKDYRRRGYATECATQMLEYGFLEMQIARIDGECAKDNIGSQKVLERIGMIATTGNEDSLHYFMTREDYKGVR